jgi:hypothetical protein
MGDYFLTVCNKPWKGPEERELGEINIHSSSNIMDERYGVDHFEVMWQKGLRYLSTILATAYRHENINREGMKEIFEELRRKVRVWIRDGCAWYRGNYVAMRVLWPCDVLDLREVQDEIEMINSRFSLSKDNPADVEIVRQSMMRFRKEIPPEELIGYTKSLHNCIRGLGDFLAKLTEFHRKYPKRKFWLIVEFD